jgi:hypothetical protein
MAQPRDPALNPSAAPLASLGIRHRSCWVLLAPGVWADWISVLTEASRQGFGVPLSSRLLLVVVLVWLGARRDWPSLLVVASMLALPILWDAHGLSIVLGVAWWARRPFNMRWIGRLEG